MAYTPTTPQAGIQPIALIPTTGTVNHPLGTLVEAIDPTYGAGTFIYLYGVASNFIGAVVTYNNLTGLTTLAPNTANLGKAVAVSMTANTSITTGSWYQVEGAAVVKKTATAVAPGAKVYVSGTIGRVMSTVASGKQYLSMTGINAATVASATSSVTLQITWPVAQGAAA
jgi:hypothetical protein